LRGENAYIYNSELCEKGGCPEKKEPWDEEARGHEKGKRGWRML